MAGAIETSVLTHINSRRRTVCCALTLFPWALNCGVLRAEDDAPAARHYLSDSDRTACFLESIQRQSVGLGTPPWSLSNDMAAFDEAKKHLTLPGSPIAQEDMDRLIEELKKTTPPTRFESAEAFYVLNNEMTLIESSAQKLKMDVPGPLLIGSLPTPNINAEVLAVPDSFSCANENARQSQYKNKIILVNIRVLSFAHETCKIVVSCIPNQQIENNISFSFGDEEIEKNIKSKPELISAYIENILEFSRIVHTSQYVVDPVYYRFLNAFRDGMEYFVLGHEFSHIALHHVSKKGTPLSAVSPPGGKQRFLSTSAVGFSWEQELEADFFGLRVAKQTILDEAQKSKDALQLLTRPIGLVAPVLFFSSLKQLEDATAIMQTGREPKITKGEYEATLEILREAFQTNKTGASDAQPEASSRISLPDHPPLWAREYFVSGFIKDSFSNYQASDKAEQGMLEIALATLRASNKLYELSKPKMFEIAAALKDASHD